MHKLGYTSDLCVGIPLPVVNFSDTVAKLDQRMRYPPESFFKMFCRVPAFKNGDWQFFPVAERPSSCLF